MNASADPAASSIVDVEIGGLPLQIEYRLIDPDRRDADLLVFLHEGLGSLGMWKDWPQEVCNTLGCRGLVFSRYGYGRSTPRALLEKWPVDFMHQQAELGLPALLQALGLDDERPVLYGHSDGGSIALLYAAMFPDKVKAIIVAAPHIFVEDITIENIEKARVAYLSTDLPQRLARYHDDVESAFWGWNDIWLHPDFRAWNIESYLYKIECPILAIQGEDDEYGTLEQIYGIQRATPQTELCILPDCGHSPHRDQPSAVVGAMRQFLEGLRPA